MLRRCVVGAARVQALTSTRSISRGGLYVAHHVSCPWVARSQNVKEQERLIESLIG